MTHLYSQAAKTTFNMHPDKIRGCLDGNERHQFVHFAAHEGMADVGAMLTQLPLLADVSGDEIIKLEREIRDAGAEREHQDLRARGIFQHLMTSDLDPRLQNIMDGITVFDDAQLHVSGIKKAVEYTNAVSETNFTL
jgi:hypothetical protein